MQTKQGQPEKLNRKAGKKHTKKNTELIKIYLICFKHPLYDIAPREQNVWHSVRTPLFGGIVVSFLFSLYPAIFHFLKASPFQFLFKIG